MTFGVAATLRRNGQVFLVDAFHGNVELASSVNHLLIVGFYLINVGFVLGLMHFLNLYVFNRRGRQNAGHAAIVWSAEGTPVGKMLD